MRLKISIGLKLQSFADRKASGQFHNSLHGEPVLVYLQSVLYALPAIAFKLMKKGSRHGRRAYSRSTLHPQDTTRSE